MPEGTQLVDGDTGIGTQVSPWSRSFTSHWDPLPVGVWEEGTGMLWGFMQVGYRECITEVVAWQCLLKE